MLRQPDPARGLATGEGTRETRADAKTTWSSQGPLDGHKNPRRCEDDLV